MNPAFTPGASLRVTTSATSVRVAIPTPIGPQLELTNEGAVPIYVAIGSSTITATVATSTPASTCYAVLPGQSKAISVDPSATHIAGITVSGDCALNVTSGAGQ